MRLHLILRWLIFIIRAMRYYILAVLIALSISLKAQFRNSGFNNISLSTGLSLYSNNADFENSISDNGSHKIANLGYGLGLSVPMYYTGDVTYVSLDAYYDYRGNANLSINSFLTVIVFNGDVIIRDKYKLSINSGVGSVFNFFQINNTQNIGKSSIDSSRIAQNSSISFNQLFDVFGLFGVKNVYIVNGKLSLFQSFDLRIPVGDTEYVYKGGGILYLPRYHINMFSFAIGLRYSFY